MIHCMVNRRFAPARRRASLNRYQKDSTSGARCSHNDVEKSTSSRGGLAGLPRILCQETSPFHQLSFCERILSSQDTSVTVGDTCQQLDEFACMSICDNSCPGQGAADQSITAGTPGSVYEKEPLSVGSVGPIQRLCLWSASRPSPYVKTNGRRGSLLGQAQGCGHTAHEPATSCESSNFSRDGFVSWFSVDYGKSSSASCLARVSSQLGDKEAAVWEGFAPLQRVLVVAVAAAAAASAKERNLKDINSLQQALDSKEQSLTLLRQELRELWDKVLFDNTSKSPMTEEVTEVLRTDGDRAVKKGLVLEDGLSHLEAAKEGTRNIRRQGSRGWDNPLFGDIMLDVEDPTEWLSVHSSVTSLDSFYGSPQRFPTHTSKKAYPEMGEAGSLMWQGSHAAVDEFRAKSGTEASASRAQCAAIILGIRKDIRVFLEKEAFAVLGAFAEVIDMAKVFQNDCDTSHSDLIDAPSSPKKGPALVALQQSIEHATELVAFLQTAVLHMYNTVGPESLAALDISPSEFEKCRQILKDGRCYTKPSAASISAWRQWLSTHGGQETWDLQEAVREDLCKSRRLLYPVDENRLSTHSYLSHSAPWSMEGADLAFALREAVSKAVDTITAPSPGLPTCSAESIAEQLLSELEIAASKVAGMEAQMSSMKACLQASEKQKQEAEVKLAEALQINKKIQAKANFDAMELTRELRLKELEYDDLQRGRKADQALLSEKSAEIQKLKEESKRRSTALESITAASQAASVANEKKLAALEDMCRRKDGSIAGLKQEIAALEKKVSELKVRSPQHVRKLSILASETTGRSLRSSLESSFEALGIEDTSVCSTPKRRESRKKNCSPPALQVASAKIPSQSVLTESTGAFNRSQVSVRESTGEKEVHGDSGANVFQAVEGNRSKTGMVMHTLNHGESRITGPYLFSDENYLSILERSTPRLQVSNPGTVAPHTTPTNPAQKRGAVVDKESEQRSSLGKAIKDSADKRRRWL